VIAIEKLTIIFNKIFHKASFPVMWSNYDIVLLLKLNKKDFRPIALSFCVLKLLEKLIKARLERFVELDLLFLSDQCGFRKGRSCDDCISLLLLEIHRSFLNHDPVGVLLDIKDAHDNVRHNILFNIVSSMKILIQYKKFVCNLIK